MLYISLADFFIYDLKTKKSVYDIIAYILSPLYINGLYADLTRDRILSNILCFAQKKYREEYMTKEKSYSVFAEEVCETIQKSKYRLLNTKEAIDNENIQKEKAKKILEHNRQLIEPLLKGKKITHKDCKLLIDKYNKTEHNNGIEEKIEIKKDKESILKEIKKYIEENKNKKGRLVFFNRLGGYYLKYVDESLKTQKDFADKWEYYIGVVKVSDKGRYIKDPSYYKKNSPNRETTYEDLVDIITIFFNIIRDEKHPIIQRIDSHLIEIKR